MHGSRIGISGNIKPNAKRNLQVHSNAVVGLSNQDNHLGPNLINFLALSDFLFVGLTVACGKALVQRAGTSVNFI